MDGPTEEAAMETYPHDEGDVTVLGPQIFVGHKPSGTPVINWRGENFEPQRLTLRVRLHNLGVRFLNARRAQALEGLESPHPEDYVQNLRDVIRQARALSEHRSKVSSLARRN